MICSGVPTIEVLSPGIGLTIQDHGRPGWKRYGVPPGGGMDSHALAMANRLVGNPSGTPAIECLLHGAQLRVLRDVRVGFAGGGSVPSTPGLWRSAILNEGTIIDLKPSRTGIWGYVAMEGGVCEPEVFGSAGAYPRAEIGRTLKPHDILTAGTYRPNVGSSWPGGHLAPWDEVRDFSQIPAIRVWRGPQFDAFEPAAWSTLLTTAWTVSSSSDRSGYRLCGATLPSPAQSMRSEPVLVGTIQIPPGGEPIVTMRDGPTVGGYPKIAIVDDASLDWLAQAAPGVMFQFVAV